MIVGGRLKKARLSVKADALKKEDRNQKDIRQKRGVTVSKVSAWKR
jgi:hypothetical protein